MTDVPPPDPQNPDGRPPQQPNPPQQPPQQNWQQQPNGQQPNWQQPNWQQQPNPNPQQNWQQQPNPNPNPQQNWQQQPNGQQPTWQQQPTPPQQPQQPWQQQNPYGQQPQQNPYGQQPPQQPPYGPPKRKRTGLIITLAVGIPVVVVAAIITVVSLVLAQGGTPVADPSPTRSATPTKTASPTPSETDSTPEPTKTYVSIPPDLDFAAGQEVPTEWTAYLTNDFDSSWAAGGKDKNGIDIYTNASTSCEVRLGNIALTQDEIAVGDDERSSDAYLAKYVGADYVKADGTTEQLNYNSGGGLIEFRVLSWTQASGERTYWGVRSLTKMGTLVVFTFTCRDQAALDQLASDVVNLISVELLPKR
ncbi:hypothetical protein [Plantibacter sp. LMC-P-059a]|uniref:hypothetical protein n=1 Tax=Plantibacter sp. LMC-P-059a TaxID=3040297 RepID=UPI00254BA442|nr:hypothetical protein [Plantibacter sp. LMC-P-059a]